MTTYSIGRLIAATSTAALIATQAMAFPVDTRFITGANQGWKSFGDAGGAPPPAAWATNGFDDSAWSNARAPYPNPNQPSALIAPPPCTPNCTYLGAQFMWHDPAGTSNGTTGVTDAYFRRHFFIPMVTPDDLPIKATMRIAADDDFEVFVNGQLAFANHDQGFADQVFTFDFTPFVLASSVGLSDNVVAIHAVDGGWGTPWDRGWESVLMEATVRSVPEPSGALLFAASVVALVATTRRSTRPPNDPAAQGGR